jgi:hypothetical protein
MMPTNQALQVCYGTLPLILVIAGICLREQMLLKDIVTRLGRIEGWLQRAEGRLSALEARAGIIYH